MTQSTPTRMTRTTTTHAICTSEHSSAPLVVFPVLMLSHDPFGSSSMSLSSPRHVAHVSFFLIFIYLPFYFDLSFSVFFYSSVLMHPDLHTDLDNLDSVENDLRHSAKESLDAYDVTHSLTEIPGGFEAGHTQRCLGAGQRAGYDSPFSAGDHPDPFTQCDHCAVGWAGGRSRHDLCLVPKKGDISLLSNWRPISLAPTLYKLYELCMWKVLDKELRPLPDQLFGFRPSKQCLDIVSFLVESLRKAEDWGEKLCVVSMDVASAFDSVRAEMLGDVVLEGGATAFSAAAAVRENLELRGRPCLGFTKSASFSLECVQPMLQCLVFVCELALQVAN